MATKYLTPADKATLDKIVADIRAGMTAGAALTVKARQADLISVLAVLEGAYGASAIVTDPLLGTYAKVVFEASVWLNANAAKLSAEMVATGQAPLSAATIQSSQQAAATAPSVDDLVAIQEERNANLSTLTAQVPRVMDPPPGNTANLPYPTADISGPLPPAPSSKTGIGPATIAPTVGASLTAPTLTFGTPGTTGAVAGEPDLSGKFPWLLVLGLAAVFYFLTRK